VFIATGTRGLDRAEEQRRPVQPSSNGDGDALLAPECRGRQGAGGAATRSASCA